ncbi:DUF4349 domain-containing protein [Spirosoma areae]
MNKILTLAIFLTAMACQSKPEQAMPASSATGDRAMKALIPEQDSPSEDEQMAPESLPAPKPGQPSVSASVSRKIIRNAQVRIRVSDFAKSGQAIGQAVRQAGGQIASSNETKSDNSIENALTIRVPATRFDALLASLLNEAIYQDIKTITSEDVTRRYVDVEARIRSKKAAEETYLRLLKQARSVDDVLKIEEQLAGIREEREVQEADLRQLKDEVALSTINLTYYQQTEVALRPEAPFYAQIWHNLTDGFRVMGSVVVGLFYFVPVGLVSAGVIWLIMRWRRQRRNVVK